MLDGDQEELLEAGSANGPKTHVRQDDPSLGAELGHLDLLGPMLRKVVAV